MSKPITIAATVPAWLPDHERVDSVMRAIKDGRHGDAISRLHLSTCDMGKGRNPWTRIGEAQVSLTLAPKDDIVAAQLKTLQMELDHARAEWLTKQQEIMERISKLQALPYEVQE
jgi:hypothetical protein